MATTRKPKVKKVKFELTKSGIGGVGVIVFCLFLWMFLLGVWSGQTLLSPHSSSKVGKAPQQQGKNSTQLIRADKKPVKIKIN
ncbi:hypothetical protein [Desulforhopalus sp. 52FAK]